MRNRALQAALEDLDSYLASDKGQVVLFDATNTTEERRQMLVRGGGRGRGRRGKEQRQMPV